MRRCGLLLPIFSLPGPEPVGTIGGSSRDFLDFLVKAGISFLQILPVPPEGLENCPYSGASAFAVDPFLLSLHDLVESGHLHADDLAQAMISMPPHASDEVPWDEMKAWKRPYLVKAARAVSLEDRQAFMARSGPWADDWALWWAISRRLPGDWSLWPAPLRDREPTEMERVRNEWHYDYDEALSLQTLVDQQWRRLRDELRVRGIGLMGDLPIYVAGGGADVWANHELFQLDGDRRPTWVAGCPPDAFSVEGQGWGNPLYDWEFSALGSHRWWRSRFRRLMELMDEIRIDHFRGFAAYYKYPAGGRPIEGQWVEGPGKSLFKAMEDELLQIRGRPGELPVVVEDLGIIDAEVAALRDDLNLRGTKVMVFGWDGDSNNPYFPEHFKSSRCCVATTTHDLEPIKAWWENTVPWCRKNFLDFARRTIADPQADIPWSMIQVALETVAEDVVVPLQDFLGLGMEARMNLPGIAKGNWKWRASVPDPALALRIRMHLEATGRANGSNDGIDHRRR